MGILLSYIFYPVTIGTAFYAAAYIQHVKPELVFIRVCLFTDFISEKSDKLWNTKRINCLKMSSRNKSKSAVLLKSIGSKPVCIVYSIRLGSLEIQNLTCANCAVNNFYFTSYLILHKSSSEQLSTTYLNLPKRNIQLTSL